MFEEQCQMFHSLGKNMKIFHYVEISPDSFVLKVQMFKLGWGHRTKS